MGKIIVDDIQHSGGDVFNLPTTDGSAGDALVTDGNGGLSFANTTPDLKTVNGNSLLGTGNIAIEVAQPVYKKTYDLETLGGQYLDVLWSSILPTGKTFSDIALVRMTGSGIAFNANTHFQLYGLDSSGATITNGYLGYCQNIIYNGQNQSLGTGNNSNNGWLRFPTYGNIYGDGQSTYGQGCTFDLLWDPKRRGTSNGGWQVSVTFTYQQNSSYDYPNNGMNGWSNYSTSAPPAAAEGGFRLQSYDGSSTFTQGDLVVELILKDS